MGVSGGNVGKMDRMLIKLVNDYCDPMKIMRFFNKTYLARVVCVENVFVFSKIILGSFL